MPAQSATTSSSAPLSDAQIQGLIRQLAIERIQNIYSQTVTPNTAPTITVQPAAVGILKRFIISISATLTNSGAAAVTPTDFCVPNLLSGIQFTDIQNNQRHATTGVFLNMLNSLRHRTPYQTAEVASATDSNGVMNYGSNWGVQSAPTSIAGSGGTGTVKFNWELPICYSDNDYRGAIYSNVLNAVMSLKLIFNSQPGVSSGDTTFAMYTGATSSTSLAITSATVNVYQVYMDQLPIQSNGYPYLPTVALSTQYLLQYVNFGSGMTVGQNFPMQYANLRSFISTLTIFNNGTSTNGGRASGTDLQTVGLQTANQSYIWQYSPQISALYTRKVLARDLPPGCYYHSFRQKNLASQNYGNLQLIYVPTTIGGVQTPYILNHSEMFANIAAVSAAGSLAAN